jgi:hypothetical protein
MTNCENGSAIYVRNNPHFHMVKNRTAEYMSPCTYMHVKIHFWEADFFMLSWGYDFRGIKTGRREMQKFQIYWRTRKY